MQDNEIYKFMKANGLTDKDEKTFLNEYSNPKKAKEVFDFFKANELTDKDETSFYDTYLKKKDSSVYSATPSQLPKISEQVSPLQQGANIVGGGVIGDISKTVPKEGTKKENQYFKQRLLGVRPSAEGYIVERVYDDPMGVGVLKVEPPKREVKPQEKPVAKAETKDKSIRGVKPIAPTEYEYDPQGWLLNMVSALDKGVYKTLGTTAQGAGTLLQGVTSKITGGTGEGFISDALIKFGDSYNKMIDELTPQDESFKGSLSDQVGQALGFVGGLALTGGASSVARGSSALMQQAPKSGALTSAVKELVKGTVSPTGVVGGLTMGQAEFDRAKQSGATDEQAFEAFYKNAAVGSVLERIPVMHFLKRFNKSTAGGVVNYIKTKGVAGLTGGLEEMTTEMLQQLYANKTAKDIYNTNQDLFEGVVGNGTIGFSVGFLLNAMGANAKILRKQGKVNEAKLVENQVKELQEKAKGVVPTNNAITTKIAVNGNEEGLQRTQAELNNDLQKGLISEEEYQEKAAIAQRVAEFNAKIPDFVQGVNRAESIQLIEERENLQQELLQKEEQKKSIDVAYHKSIDESNKEVQKRIDEINNKIIELSAPTEKIITEEIKPESQAIPLQEEVESQVITEQPITEELTPKTEEYAIFQPTAGEIPIQPEAAISEEVEGRKPKTELEEIAPIKSDEEKVAVSEFGDLSKMTDKDIENRMTEIENDNSKGKEFDFLEKEMEKRERATIFNVSLDKVNDAIDALIIKEKDMPNGWGAFIEPRDAIETKEIADKYLNAKSISDVELKKDFKDAVFGRPDSWYADGLKLRESIKEAANRGIDTQEMVREIELEFERDGYTAEEAREMVARKLAPIFKGSESVQTSESKLLTSAPKTEKIEPQKITKEKSAEPTKETGEKAVKEKAKDDLGSKARKLASDLRKGDKAVLPDWLKADLPKGTKLQGVDINEAFAMALDTFADVYDKAKDFKKAVEEGFKHIKDYFEENNIEYNEFELKNKFSDDLIDRLELESQRRFTARMLKTEGVLPVAEIAKTLDYVKQKNVISIEEANDIIKKVGLDEAFNLVKDSRDMNGGVRSVLGQSLISRYNNLAKIATDQAEKDFYWDKTIEVANYVTEKLATDAGQMIQAFSLWSKLSPEALFRNAQKDMQRQGEIAKKKAKKDTDAITKKLKKANEEAVEEVLASKELQSELGKVEQKEKSKAAAKIKKAQEKRKSIIDKYKNNKGGITLSTGGLTPEGIEFIGEVAKTYIDEGIANLELIVEKILEDYKSISGKDADKKIIDQIRDISSEKISDKLVKSTGKGIVDMKLKISEIVKQHYTEVDAIKKKLSDKFVKEAGLDPEQSKLLADKISAEFDRIANNKKKKILEQENKRLERAKNKLKPTKATSVKELHQLILKYTNLGGFGSDEILDLLAEKVGTGNLTREEGIRLQELAEKVRVAPDGSPKNDAIQNLLNYQAQLKGISAGELSQAVWYASLLAGYKTHIKNIVANLFNTFSELSVQGIKSPISSPFLMAGLFKGYRRGFIEAMHTLKTGKSPIHISKVEVSNVLEMKSFEGGMLNPFNLLKYVSRAMVAADVFAFQGLKEARSYQLAYSEAVKLGGKNITQKQYWNVRNPFDKKIWNIVNEKLFNTKQRYEDAVQIVQFEKLTGLEAKRRIFEIMEQTRDFKIVEDAYNFAARGTFNYPPEGVLGALNNRLSVFLDIQFGGTKPLRYIVPFTRILTNVANTALDYEPIIGIRRAIRGKIGFESFKESSVTKNAYREMTAEERRTQITKVAISISTIAMLYALSKMEDDEGNPIVEITGGGSIDFNKTNQLKERGWQPYSIKIGDKYYSYKLTPLIISLGYIGNLNDYEKYDSKGDSDMIDKMSQTAFRTSDILTDMTWVGSTTEFMDNFFSQGDEGKGKKMQKWLENQAKTAIPFMQPYTQISQGVQDLFNIPQKESSQFGANLIKDIPIARNYLYDKINVLGDKIYKSSAVVVSGKKVQNAESDVILDYLQSKNVFISPIKRQSVIIWDDKEKMERPLTMQEYYDYSKLRGELIKNEMIDLMNNGRWVVEDENEVLKRAADLNKDQLKKEVDNISKKATQKAKEILFVKEDN